MNRGHESEQEEKSEVDAAGPLLFKACSVAHGERGVPITRVHLAPAGVLFLTLLRILVLCEIIHWRTPLRGTWVASGMASRLHGGLDVVSARESNYTSCTKIVGKNLGVAQVGRDLKRAAACRRARSACHGVGPHACMLA